MIRRFFRDLPIVTKLRVIITGACVLMVFLTCIALAACEWWVVREAIGKSLVSRSQIFSANAAAALMFNRPDDAEQLLGALKSDPNLTSGAIFRPDGTLFAQYLAPKTPAIAPPPGPDLSQVLTLHDATVWLPMAAENGRTIGTMALRMPLDVIYDRLQIYLMASIVVGLAAALIAYGLSNRLQGVISHPLLSLAKVADRVTEEKDFAVRAETLSRDEIGRLAHAFNSMLATIQAGEAESARLYDQVRVYATGLEARVRERTAQLQIAYDDLESFSYSVSHDLRSPLRHIAGYTEALLEENQGKLSAESAEYSRRILQGVQRMDTLIKSLLEFAQSTKWEPVLQFTDVAKLAREIATELLPRSANPEAIVTVDALSPCQADRVLLRQVLVNLLDNAIKYSRDRRAAARITVTQIATAEAGMNAYVVKDNGIGFDPGAANQLFNVFVRLHNSKQFEGTGVGLATVKRIVQRHGGRIWAEAAPDAGAAFYFTLPRADQSGREANKAGKEARES